MTALNPITLEGPGLRGLNTQSSTLPPEWARILTNCVFDEGGNLTARKGYNKLTASAVEGGEDIEQIFEYEKDKDTRVILSAVNEKLYKGTTTLTDITGSVAPSASNWKFQNFNGKVVAAQQGEELISWAGASNFVTIQSTLTAWTGSTSYSLGAIVRKVSGETNLQFVCTTAGTSHASIEPTWATTDIATTTDNTVTWTTHVMPKGDDVLAAFGRVWALTEDGSTVKYSALLDETDWGNGGSFDLSKFWGGGTDFAVALAEFNNLLIVFGHRNTLIYTGAVSPASIALNDTLEGIGCVARGSVQSVADDLFFLDATGVRSLLRSVELKSQPLREVSKNVRDALLIDVAAATLTQVRSVYNPVQGFYALILQPTTWIFDTQRPLEDLSARVVQWTDINMKSVAWSSIDKLMYIGKEGEVGTYSGYQDDGASYNLTHRTVWTDFASPGKKIPKVIKATILGGAGATATFQWGVDFSDLTDSCTLSVDNIAVSEWNVAEWGLDEFTGGDSTISNLRCPMSLAGQHLSFGVTVSVNGNSVSIRKIDLYAKLGRMGH